MILTTEILKKHIEDLIKRQDVLEFLKNKGASQAELDSYTTAIHAKIATAPMRKILFDEGKTLEKNLGFNDTHMYYVPYIVEAIKKTTGNNKISLGMNPGEYRYVKYISVSGSGRYDFKIPEKIKTPKEERISFVKKLDTT